MMMTLVSSAKRHDLDVGLYIRDVLDQLLAGSTDYESLLLIGGGNVIRKHFGSIARCVAQCIKLTTKVQFKIDISK